VDTLAWGDEYDEPADTLAGAAEGSVQVANRRHDARIVAVVALVAVAVAVAVVVVGGNAGGDGVYLVVDEKGVFREDNFAAAMAVLTLEPAVAWDQHEDAKRAADDASWYEGHARHLVVAGAQVDENFQLLAAPAQLALPRASVNVTVGAARPGDGAVRVDVSADAFALYVWLSTLAQGRFDANFFAMRAGQRSVYFLPFAGFNATEFAATLRAEHVGLYL
jgi:hypothetical protein